MEAVQAPRVPRGSLLPPQRPPSPHPAAARSGRGDIVLLLRHFSQLRALQRERSAPIFSRGRARSTWWATAGPATSAQLQRRRRAHRGARDRIGHRARASPGRSCRRGAVGDDRGTDGVGVSGVGQQAYCGVDVAHPGAERIVLDHGVRGLHGFRDIRETTSRHIVVDRPRADPRQLPRAAGTIQHGGRRLQAVGIPQPARLPHPVPAVPHGARRMTVAERPAARRVSPRASTARGVGLASR